MLQCLHRVCRACEMCKNHICGDDDDTEYIHMAIIVVVLVGVSCDQIVIVVLWW